MPRLRASFTKEGILKARAVEDRLMKDTWSKPEYNLLPELNGLKIPTLVIYSDHDIIPTGTAEHIAQAIPNARMVTLKNCGHFPYLECPDAPREQIDDFFRAR
jgi:proline iminopeptidase